MMSKKVSSEIQTHQKITVVAIGGGAINAQNYMIDCGMQGMDFNRYDTKGDTPYVAKEWRTPMKKAAASAAA